MMRALRSLFDLGDAAVVAVWLLCLTMACVSIVMIGAAAGLGLALFHALGGG